MNLYCTNHLKSGNTAGSKAPADCYTIASRLGAKELVFRHPRTHGNVNVTRFFALFTGITNWIRLLVKTKKDSLVIIQHPNEGIEVARIFMPLCKKIKGVNFIALIHDLESLRMIGINGLKQMQKRNQVADNELLSLCDFIIAHNPQMRQYLIQTGFSGEKVYSLGVFDYLCNDNEHRSVSKENGVIVAGNLARYKCEYLYRLLEDNDNVNFQMHLYGPNYDGKASDNVNYHGQFNPDELINHLEGSFGLVWDGTDVDTCSGNTGEYLRYNNPHKFSMFLAANIPVIIWKHAALADFVVDNGVGIVIDSLSELEEAMAAVSESDYSDMISRVKIIGEKIRNGGYLSSVLNEIIH